MCDYSLQALHTRDAEVGDRLISTVFPGTITRGLASETDCGTAVCIRPGSELGFEHNITERTNYALIGTTKVHDYTVAKFLQVGMEDPYRHHDALELPDGTIVLINDLAPNQHCSVLQLPAAPKTAEEAKAQERCDVVA